MSTLSCGHSPSPHGEHTTGTATLPDGKEVCYACADARQRERMLTSTRLDAYLSDDGMRITTWTGGLLATVTSNVKRRVGFYRTIRTYLRAVDATGKHWYGSSPGAGMYARLRAKPAIYCTTYCNKGHRLSDGKPVQHECHVLPPAALQAEREDRHDDAARLIKAAKPLRIMRRGVKG